MNPILYTDVADLGTQGQGTLTDTISCEVTEERNGAYELEMTYPIDGIHFDEISLRSCICAKPNYTDNPQLFRVYKITKPLNGVCTIFAQHISYDMSGYVVPSGQTANTLAAALDILNAYSGDFLIDTTKSGQSTFSTDVPSSVRSWLGGKRGSLLDLFGGEWHWDNYTAMLATNRGANRGVTIRYGKNLTELTQESSSENLFTAVQCYFADNDGNVVSGNAVPTGISLDTPKVLLIDASQDFGSDSIPAVGDLDNYATTYIADNNLIAPTVNIELDFVQLQGLSERVDLCDTVTITFDKLGVNATAKCIETTWDVLKERYTNSVFGTARHTLADTVNGIANNANDLTYLKNNIQTLQSEFEAAIQNATSLITGNQGGYVSIRDTDDDGHPDEIVIMDTPDITTATKVWRWNSNGLGYSSTGYNGEYGIAIASDGTINAQYIASGTISADKLSSELGLLLESYNSRIELLNGQVEVFAQTAENVNSTFDFTPNGLDIRSNQNSKIYSHIGADTYQFRRVSDDVQVFAIDEDGTTGKRADVTGQLGIGSGEVNSYVEQWAIRKGALQTDSNQNEIGYDLQIVWIGG